MDEIARLTPTFAGVSYEKLDRLGSIQWPCNDAAPEGTPVMHEKTFVCGKGKFMLVPRMSISESGEFVPLKNVPFDADDVLVAEQQSVADIAALLTKRGTITGALDAPKRNHRLSLSTGVKYARALDAKDKKDPSTQKKLLAEVVKEQPDFKLAQLDLLSLRD